MIFTCYRLSYLESGNNFGELLLVIVVDLVEILFQTFDQMFVCLHSKPKKKRERGEGWSEVWTTSKEKGDSSILVRLTKRTKGRADEAPCLDNLKEGQTALTFRWPSVTGLFVFFWATRTWRYTTNNHNNNDHNNTRYDTTRQHDTMTPWHRGRCDMPQYQKEAQHTHHNTAEVNRNVRIQGRSQVDSYKKQSRCERRETTNRDTSAGVSALLSFVPSP